MFISWGWMPASVLVAPVLGMANNFYLDPPYPVSHVFSSTERLEYIHLNC